MAEKVKNKAAAAKGAPKSKENKKARAAQPGAKSGQKQSRSADKAGQGAKGAPAKAAGKGRGANAAKGRGDQAGRSPAKKNSTVRVAADKGVQAKPVPKRHGMPIEGGASIAGKGGKRGWKSSFWAAWAR